MIRTEDGEYIAAMRSRDPERAGLPLHRMLPDGTVANSFGADPPIPSSGERDQFVRKLAPGAGSLFWAGALTRYELEEWTSGGELRQAMRQSVDWFPEQDEFGPGDPESAPKAGLRALHLDGDGLLWVAVAVPDENWRTAYEDVPDRLGLSDFQVDYNRAYDTIIERIDPNAREVKAQVRLDGYLSWVCR